MSAIINVEDVTFSYGDTVAVDDVTFTVDDGEFLGLIGPNGSGKTTLLHLMLGLNRPDTGSLSLFGTPAHEFEAGERIGYVGQRAADRGDAMPVTVRETVLMGRFARAGRSRLTDQDREIAHEAMQTVDVFALADRRISSLSGGQRQRVFIARALASEADILALDEPTVGIDANSRDRFYDLLDELNDTGMTIILIEHDIGVLTKHVDTVACINVELYHHGDTVSFLESDALADAYGRASGILEHDHQ